jgi:hypothetical protein
MSPVMPITERILESLRSTPECAFEDIVAHYPEFSWNELYIEVSRLSRKGQVIITRGVGTFTIRQTALSK